MSWKLIDRPKTLKVTKALATNYAEMEPAPHDRPLSERRLTVYGKLIAEGKFRPVTWASAICKETGGLYRVNGKHTSVLLSGLEKMPDFFVTVEEYECDTLQDVAQLYATFDSAMMARTARDIYLSFASTVPELAEVNSKVISVAATGVAYHRFGQDLYGRTQPAERAEMLLEHSDFVLWLYELSSGGSYDKDTGGKSNNKSSHLLRLPVAAAMFATWSKSKHAATEFWSAVRDDSGTAPNLPDRKLSRYLLTSTMRSNQSQAKKTVGNREMYVKCLHAWNAWRNKEATNLNYHADKPVPAVK